MAGQPVAERGHVEVVGGELGQRSDGTGVSDHPRGEVGLIFAGIGASLVIQGHAVVSPETYAAAVFMVVVTTMATPPLLLWSLKRDGAAAPS